MKHPLSDPGFEASELFPNRQVFLLSFFITLIQSVDLRGDFVKTPTNFISKRLNLSLQFLLQKQPQSFHFVFVEWHGRYISPTRPLCTK